MPLNREQQIIADDIKRLFELIPAISELEKQVQNNPHNLALMCNTTFVTRKCVEVLDSMKKKLNALEESAARQASENLISCKPPRYSTEFATISDNSDLYVVYPTAPDKPGYYDFVTQLGPDLVRPHYPSVLTEIERVVGAGGQFPWGLKAEDCKGVNYKLRLTAKKQL